MRRSLCGIRLLGAGFAPVSMSLTLTLFFALISPPAAVGQFISSQANVFIVPPATLVTTLTVADLGLDPNSSILTVEGGDFGTVKILAGTLDSFSYSPASPFWSVGLDSLVVTTEVVGNPPAENKTEVTKVFFQAGSRRDHVFLDDYEIPNPSPSRQIGGDPEKLEINAAAALNGLKGLQVTTETGDPAPAYLSYSMDRVPGCPKGDPDDGALDVTMDPDGPAPIIPDSFALIQAIQPPGSAPIPGLPEPLSFQIELQAPAGVGYQVRAVAYDQTGGHPTVWYSITDEAHKLSLDWWTERDEEGGVTGAGILLRIDDRFVDKVEYLGTALPVNAIRLGVMDLSNPIDQVLNFDDLQLWVGDLVGEKSLFFDDQFGGATTWSSMSQGGGTLSNGFAAALAGDSGLEVSLQATSHVFLQSVVPIAEDSVTARFLFDPNSIDLVGDHLALFVLLGQDNPVAGYRLQVRLRQTASAYQVLLDVWDIRGHTASPWVNLIDGPQSLTVQWWNAGALRVGEGRARLWVNSGERAEILGIETGSGQIEALRFGVLGINGPTGSIYFDEFEIWR